MKQSVGVLAVQGDYEKHIDAFARASVPKVLQVRTVEDLAEVDRLVIPGGESTTVGKLLQRFGLGEAIMDRVRGGMPVWGTCMGMILMAREVEGSDQYRLNALDITVSRNAFGAQIHSFEDDVQVSLWDTPLTAVFIRAPVVVQVGASVDVLAVYKGQTVAVKQGNRLGTSFHPELTEDLRFHEWFRDLEAP